MMFELIGESNEGCLDLDCSLAESRMLICWEEGQPHHPRPGLAAMEKLL